MLETDAGRADDGKQSRVLTVTMFLCILSRMSHAKPNIRELRHIHLCPRERSAQCAEGNRHNRRLLLVQAAEQTASSTGSGMRSVVQPGVLAKQGNQIYGMTARVRGFGHTSYCMLLTTGMQISPPPVVTIMLILLMAMLLHVAGVSSHFHCQQHAV